MNIDWEKLFGTFADFVTVMLSGMILAFFLQVISTGDFSLPELGSSKQWLVFLGASYVLGHIVFLVGARLDDWVYEPIRTKTSHTFISELAEGKTPDFDGCLTRLARWFFKKHPDRAVAAAERLKAITLGSPEAGRAINAYKWSRQRLRRDRPEEYASVLRFESDSKFFRSLIVLIPFIVFACAKSGHWIPVTGVLLVTPLVIFRYIDQRFKATEEAYTQVITLDGATLLKSADALTGRWAGGVVCAKEQGGFLYLLVETSTAPKRWVLPKGRVEPGETPRFTAVREVFEETGVYGSVRRHLCNVDFGTTEKPQPVSFYLLERVAAGAANAAGDPGSTGALARSRCSGLRQYTEPVLKVELWQEDRPHCWVPYKEAADKLGDFKESAKVLDLAAEKIKDPAKGVAKAG